MVVVFFWSVGVPESARLMQALLPLYHVYKDLGLEVVAICIDKDVETAVNIFEDRLPPWQALFQHDEEAYQLMLDDFGIQMLPYTLIIDKAGVVTDINVQEPDLNSKIRQRLNVKDDPAASN